MDILETSKAKDRLMVAALIDRWFADQITDTLVFVARPGRDGQFVKLPDGSFNPPPGVADTLTVDIDGRMTQIFNSSFPVTAFISNVYDTLDRVQTQIDAANNTWNLYIAGARSEEVDPLGNSHIWYFDERGNTLKETDALGNTVVDVYDDQNRLVGKTRPEGNQVITAYDESNHKPLTITQASKTGALQLRHQPILRPGRPRAQGRARDRRRAQPLADHPGALQSRPGHQPVLTLACSPCL